MPRGKRTVFAVFCADAGCSNPGERLGTLRFHKQDKQGKSWKEHAEGLQKYCKSARKRVHVKLKEEKHTS